MKCNALLMHIDFRIGASNPRIESELWIVSNIIL